MTFLPEIGTIRELSLPDGIRVDAGVEQGDGVSTRYDPMVAKMIAHGHDRDAARSQLAAALERTQIRGVVTNIALLRWILTHEDFRSGPVRTDFFELHPPLEYNHRVPPAWCGYFRLGRDAALEKPRTAGAAQRRSSAASEHGGDWRCHLHPRRSSHARHSARGARRGRPERVGA